MPNELLILNNFAKGHAPKVLSTKSFKSKPKSKMYFEPHVFLKKRPSTGSPIKRHLSNSK
jgi:hypothetical protein